MRNYETVEERTLGNTGVLSTADYEKLHKHFQEKANDEQKAFFERIKTALIFRHNEHGKKKPYSPKFQRLHFLTGDGGVGKTFLYNVRLLRIFTRKQYLYTIIHLQLIISWAKKERMNVASCASTGLAAADLIDGQTAHSRFRISPDVKEDTMPKLLPGQLLTEIIRLTDLIVLDEVSALHINVLKYIDKSCLLADPVNAASYNSETGEDTEIPFAGKVNIFAFMPFFLSFYFLS